MNYDQQPKPYSKFHVRWKFGRRGTAYIEETFECTKGGLAKFDARLLERGQPFDVLVGAPPVRIRTR